MTTLRDLHRRLWRLARRRQRFRWIIAYSGLLVAALLGLGAMFAIDCLFQVDVGPRSVLVALLAAEIVWAFIRYTAPFLRTKEGELDVALLVERQEHIDCDLVAALQFESPDAPNWGSIALEQAVIDDAAARGERLNITEALPRSELRRRLRLLGVVAAVWLVLAAAKPLYVATFLNRLFLGRQHYPTRTRIEGVEVNHHAFDPVRLGAPPPHQSFWSILTARADAGDGRRALKIHYGEAARFQITCAGDYLPKSGRVVVRAASSGLPATVELVPAPPKNQPAQSEERAQRLFVGELPRLIEPVDFQIYLGDAWTESARLETAQLPVVDVELEVFPPPYANKVLADTRMSRHMRQVSVIEGSRVVAHVRSDKVLKDCTMTIDQKELKLRPQPGDPQAGAPPAGGGRVWLFNPQGTPMEAVLQPVRYAVQVTDVDDQKLDKPIEGLIRVLSDLAPRIAAATNTPLVVPVATPTIYYQAIDDHALGRIWLTYEVMRGGQPGNDRPPIAAGEMEIYRYQEGQPFIRNKEDAWTFDVSKVDMGKPSARLEKGDTIKAVLHAEDYRGGRQPQAASSEPLVFQVTDEQGILTSMLEADKHSAAEMKSMIRRQLGIGETP